MGVDLTEDYDESDGLDGDSARGKSPSDKLRGARARRRVRLTQQAIDDTNTLQGVPSFASLRPTLLFLAFPALLAFLIVITGGHWPAIILYPIAIAIGLYVAASSYRSMEIVTVCIIFYLPFAHEYAVNIAPGLNGTNAVILLGLFATVLRVYARREGWATFIPGTFAVVGFGAYTALSGFTIMRETGGWDLIIYSELVNYKGWLDQFFIYFILLNAIRDKDMAKRVIIYMAISSMVVVISAIPEMLGKMGLSTIEKSRLGGPYGQANNFGGFIAYSILPLVAMFMVYIENIKSWLLTPYFLLAAKVLITTFSRGAYLAIAMGGLMAAWFRGKRFMITWAFVGIVGLALFPQLLPESILARINQTTQGSGSTVIRNDTQLDASSEYRLIMWKAAGEMILDSPILGKGYKGFQLLKADYTEVDLPWLSDPHNMYLFIGAQMGVPALSLFILILINGFRMGWRLSKHKHDQFIRSIGIGGAAAVIAYSLIAMFGSRMVTLDFTVHFWALYVVLQVLAADDKLLDTKGPLRKKPTRGVSASRIAEEAGTAMVVHSDVVDQENSGPSRRKRRNNRQAEAHRAEYQAAEAKRKTKTKRSRTNAFEELKRQQNGDSE